CLRRVATNVCRGRLRGAPRRPRPMDFEPSVSPESNVGPLVPEHEWIQPMADSRMLPSDADPSEMTTARESVRLAFVAALQHLPPKQRAVLILREVLRWHADEVAQLLDTSVASVNSALQRARATLAASGLDDTTSPSQVDPEHRDLLARYVDAFERYDVSSIVKLLHDEAAFTMPPYALWLRGPTEIGRFYLGQGIGCRGSRLLATSANGCPAFGAYKPSGPGTFDPWAIQVI